jgi:hypothetical protein
VRSSYPAPVGILAHGPGDGSHCGQDVFMGDGGAVGQ